ncbi:hypothetical protein IWX92DRAFT_382536 [Phyllosticta citricarpa]
MGGTRDSRKNVPRGQPTPLYCAHFAPASSGAWGWGEASQFRLLLPLLRGTFARCLALELLAKYFHNASLPWHVDQYIRNISREGLVGRCEPVLDGGGMVGYDSATNRNVPVGQRSCASLPVQIPRMFNTPPHNWQATTAPHGTLAPIASQSLRESQKLFHAVPSLGSQWDASVSTDSVLTNAGKPRHEECKVLMSLFPSLRS